MQSPSNLDSENSSLNEISWLNAEDVSSNANEEVLLAEPINENNLLSSVSILPQLSATKNNKEFSKKFESNNCERFDNENIEDAKAMTREEDAVFELEKRNNSSKTYHSVADSNESYRKFDETLEELCPENIVDKTNANAYESENYFCKPHHICSSGPDVVHISRNLEEDTVTFERVICILTHAMHPLYFGIKVAFFVTLPLCLLAFSDGVKNNFKGIALLPVWGTANSAVYLGQQMCNIIFVYQSAIWMIIWGTFTAAVGAQHNEPAWWCLAFVGMMFVSFFTNLRSRRLMINFTMVTMMTQRIPGNDYLTYSAQVGSNILLGITFAAFQSFIPYPVLISRKTDETFANAWNEVVRIADYLHDVVGPGKAFIGYVNTALSFVDDLGATIDSIPELLFLCSFEPFERSLWNQLRYKRLALLKRLQVILYATCTSARLVTSMTTAQTRESSLHWQRILRHPTEEYLEALQLTMKEFGTSLEPANTIERCHFDDLQNKKDDLIKAIQDCRSWVGRNSMESTNAAAFYSFLYFHLMLALLSEEMRTFAEQMNHFDPSTCKSTWRRCAEFFVLDFWDDFRNDLLDRFLLRTEESRRALKDGFKLACAYCAAAAFTLRLNEDNTADTYYFGMAIIIGIGLPTASESVEIGTHRICGMIIALTVGYLSMWKTYSYGAQIAVLVAGVFIAVCFRNNRRYMHVAWYSSFIIPAAYGIAYNKVTMIARVVDNTFSVISYCFICIVLFPLNPFRVSWTKLIVIEKTVADTITTLASILNLPLEHEYREISNDKMKIVEENLQNVKTLLVQSKIWSAICVNEPVVFGKPFPAERVNLTQNLLNQIAASMETWLFGLQIFYRAREANDEVHPIVIRAQKLLASMITDLEVVSRVVFQELVDCVDDPLEWTPLRSVQKMSDFVRIHERFTLTFNKLHAEVINAQSNELRRAMFTNKRNELTSQTFSFVGGLSFMNASGCNCLKNRSSNNNINNNELNENQKCQSLTNTSIVCSDNNQKVSNVNKSSKNNSRYLLESNNLAFYDFPSNTYPPRDTPLQAGIFASAAVEATRSFDPSFTSTINDACSNSSNLSFRAPVGTLPIDMDVTACTVILVSLASLISLLEQIVPNVFVFNAFEQSRYAKRRLNLKDFFMRPTSENRESKLL